MFSIHALGVLISDGLAELLNRSASLTLSKFAEMYLQFPSSKSQSVSTFEERDPRPIAREIL